MNDQSVTYTVKELIGMLERTLTEQMDKIVGRLDGIEQKLDGKSSNIRVEALEHRIGAGEERITKLELLAAGTAAVTTFQRWALGTVGVGCLGAIATLVWLAAGGH